MKRQRTPVARWIGRYLAEEAPRSKSLIISAFGDSIAPFVDGIWLGVLIELMAPLGLNERLVRTSGFRLIEEGWLRARREGRRSYYGLTATGQDRFEQAYSHIYTPPETAWDGLWTQVIVPRQADAAPERADFRRELSWAGFAPVSTGLYVHPSVPSAEITAIVRRYALGEQVIVLRARDADLPGTCRARAGLLEAWNLERVSARYEGFNARFQPLLDIIEHHALSPLDGFLVQTLLIHSFRRASLNDPRLPGVLLPDNWPGLRAFALCKALYTHTLPLTTRHLSALPGFESMDCSGNRLSMPVGARFGGVISTHLAA